MDDEDAKAVLGPIEGRPAPNYGLTPIFVDSFTVFVGPEVVRIQMGDTSADSKTIGPLLADVVMQRSRAERLAQALFTYLAQLEGKEDAAGVPRPFEPPIKPQENPQ